MMDMFLLLPLTVLQGAAVVVVFVWRLWKVHTRVRVQSRVVSLPLCMAQDRAPQLPQTHCGFVKHSVLSIIEQAVGDHKVEVSLQVSKRAVLVSLQLGPHGGEVHGLRDKLQVIWYLRCTENTIIGRMRYGDKFILSYMHFSHQAQKKKKNSRYIILMM